MKLTLFGRKNVDLTLTPRALEKVTAWKNESKLESAIMSIGWGRWDHEAEDRWTIGFYEERMLVEGWVGIAPQIKFVTIQEWILDAVNGKTLDIVVSGAITIS